MLAKLVPDESTLLHRASLTAPMPMAEPALPAVAPLRQTAKPAPLAKPESLVEIQADPPEPLLADEGEEQEDDIAFDPLPATFLLAEKPLSYSDVPDGQTREPVFQKIGLLMAPASVLASEEFDHRLQIEDLYEANSFRGRAVAFAERLRARMSASLEANTKQALR